MGDPAPQLLVKQRTLPSSESTLQHAGAMNKLTAIHVDLRWVQFEDGCIGQANNCERFVQFKQVNFTDWDTSPGECLWDTTTRHRYTMVRNHRTVRYDDHRTCLRDGQ